MFVYCTAHPAKGKIVSLLTSLTVEGITIAHLSGLNHELTEAQLALFEGADILMVPIGGNNVLDAKQAHELVANIEPRIVIPMHFAQSGLKTKYASAAAFLKETGAKTQEQDKLKITKKDLPQETMEIVYITP